MTPARSSSTARIVAAFLFAATLPGCDEAPEQGIIVDDPQPRSLGIDGDLAIYSVELDGETRRIEVLLPSDGQVFRILDGDRVELEVIAIDGDDPTFRAHEAGPWSPHTTCDAVTEATAELVLDGGLTPLDGDEFRRRMECGAGPFLDCMQGGGICDGNWDCCSYFYGNC